AERVGSGQFGGREHGLEDPAEVGDGGPDRGQDVEGEVECFHRLAGFGDGGGPVAEGRADFGEGTGGFGDARQELIDQGPHAFEERFGRGGEAVEDDREGLEGGGDGVAGGGLGEEFADGGDEAAEGSGGEGHALAQARQEVLGDVGDGAAELLEQGVLDVEPQVGERGCDGAEFTGHGLRSGGEV